MNIVIKEITTKLNIAEIYDIFKEDKNSVLLDSSKEDKNLSKYSFIGINPYKVFESFGKKAFIDGRKVNGNPFDVLNEILNEYKIDEEINNIPFLAGCIGYISYDTCRIIEKINDISEEDIKIPDMRFVFYKNLIIFDLLNNKKYITSLDDETAIRDIMLKINRGEKFEEKEYFQGNNKFISNFTKEEYMNSITKLKDYIRNGDVYIANMTQRFMCSTDRQSFDIYKDLRQINKAPFSAFMNYDDFQIISSSPERFIQIYNGYAHTRPIKGTRPRGKNKEEDEFYKNELINSEKDKAELLMVVDLERNDFSKVCEPHSVKVTELFSLEEYATVFHLVSTVEGKLKSGVSSVKCISECFPGGSITGTPKIRAMEIIEELEGLKRNIYTGCIGYFDFRGYSDFNIAIRTILKKDDKAYFGVGGGITYDSIEEDEYYETLDKAKALMKVL